MGSIAVKIIEMLLQEGGQIAAWALASAVAAALVIVATGYAISLAK